MADLTDAQRKRAEARQRRRGQDGAEAGDETQNADGAAAEPLHGVKQAAKVAAAAGAAGAAAAAARALTSHRAAEPDDERPESQEPDAAADPEEEEPHELEPETQPEPREPEPGTDSEPPREPVAGAGRNDAREVIDRAREQLEDLLGRPVESVSSLERTHDGWVLALEVVELSRVPDSTDVLASYEMELDNDLGLRRYQQARRYHRGRADLGDEL